MGLFGKEKQKSPKEMVRFITYFDLCVLSTLNNIWKIVKFSNFLCLTKHFTMLTFGIDTIEGTFFETFKCMRKKCTICYVIIKTNIINNLS